VAEQVLDQSLKHTHRCCILRGTDPGHSVLPDRQLRRARAIMNLGPGRSQVEPSLSRAAEHMAVGQSGQYLVHRCGVSERTERGHDVAVGRGALLADEVEHLPAESSEAVCSLRVVDPLREQFVGPLESIADGELHGFGAHGFSFGTSNFGDSALHQLR
jgi:hypothetical protein